jgi:hypothetical protein
MDFLGTEMVSSKEDLPLEEEDWPWVFFDFLNNFSGPDNDGTSLGSGFVLVTLFFENEDDTRALVGSNFGPFTSLLGAKTSAMESPGEKYAV